MSTSLFQKIIDKLRGKPVRFYAIDKKIKVSKTADIDNNTVLGDYTYVGNHTTITRAVIGRYCSIGNNVTIGPGEHNINEISTSGHLSISTNDYKGLTKDDCTIGNDVWIGVDAIVRRGVKIGNGAIIGANSFVNRDVPDFAVVAGSPAKIIKMRFNEEKIKQINESKYWEYSPKKAKEILKEISEN